MFSPVVFVLTILCSLCSGYIYILNETEYHRMPRLFFLDPYEPCLYANNGTGVYCSVKFDLVTDQPSDLFDIIREYSAKKEIHFNHSRLTYGICLTETCLKFYQRNITENPGVILEACLNDTFWKKYKLKTQVSEVFSCDTVDTIIDFDTLDIVVAIFIGFFLMLNIIGSLQEVYFGEESDQKGNRLLSCFAFQRNWKIFISPVCEGPNDRLSSLKGFSCIKAFSMLIVIIVHSTIPAELVNDNPHYLEKNMLTNRLTQTLLNAPLMVQSFFIVSSFLLAMNLQIIAEKQKINWLYMLKVLFYRFWRLFPVLFTVMGLYLTWGRHLGPGPLYQDLVHREVEDCRRDWWQYLLFINNYVDYSYCMPHAWYLAADTQLFYVGLLVFWLTSGRGRKIVLGLLFLVGVFMSAAHTYYQDLDAILLTSPECVRNLFIKDENFNHTYKRGHTNLASYVMGFSLGLLIYRWKTNEFKIHVGFKLRLLFWVSLPSMLVLPYYCGAFYMDAPRTSLFMRTLYSALFKPLWSTSLLVFIVGLVYKFDRLINGICEWQLWAIPSRLSYSMYVIHLVIIKLLIGTRTTLIHMTYLKAIELAISTYAITLVAAVPIYLLIEAPLNQFIKVGLLVNKTKDESIKAKEMLQSGDIKDKENGIHNKNGVAKQLQDGEKHKVENGDINDKQNGIDNKNGVIADLQNGKIFKNGDFKDMQCDNIHNKNGILRDVQNNSFSIFRGTSQYNKDKSE